MQENNKFVRSAIRFFYENNYESSFFPAWFDIFSLNTISQFIIAGLERSIYLKFKDSNYLARLSKQVEAKIYSQEAVQNFSQFIESNKDIFPELCKTSIEEWVEMYEKWYCIMEFEGKELELENLKTIEDDERLYFYVVCNYNLTSSGIRDIFNKDKQVKDILGYIQNKNVSDLVNKIVYLTFEESGIIKYMILRRIGMLFMKISCINYLEKFVWNEDCLGGRSPLSEAEEPKDSGKGKKRRDRKKKTRIFNNPIFLKNL